MSVFETRRENLVFAAVVSIAASASAPAAGRGLERPAYMIAIVTGAIGASLLTRDKCAWVLGAAGAVATIIVARGGFAILSYPLLAMASRASSEGNVTHMAWFAIEFTLILTTATAAAGYGSYLAWRVVEQARRLDKNRSRRAAVRRRLGD